MSLNIHNQNVCCTELLSKRVFSGKQNVGLIVHIAISQIICNHATLKLPLLNTLTKYIINSIYVKIT